MAGNPYWTWGHRNPQGLVFANNKLYSSEHGPGNDDEINIIENIKKNNFSGDMFVLLRINNQDDAQLVEFLKQIANGGQRWSAVKDFFLRTARAAMWPYKAGDDLEPEQDPQMDLALASERKL